MAEPELADGTALAAYRSRGDDLLLAQAEALVRSYCRWHIAPSRPVDVTVDGSGVLVQPLPTLYLTSVTAVLEDGVALDLEEAGVQWSTSGYLWRPNRWTRRLRGVQASITHGYAEVPVEVQAVVLDVLSRASVAATIVRTETAGPFSRSLVTNADGSSVGGVTLTELEKCVLDRYRVPAGH